MDTMTDRPLIGGIPSVSLFANAPILNSSAVLAASA